LTVGLVPKNALVFTDSLSLARQGFVLVAFSFPVDEGVAIARLKEFSNWFPKVLEKITAGCGMSAVGTSYERVHVEVLDFLHLDRNILSPEFSGSLTLYN